MLISVTTRTPRRRRHDLVMTGGGDLVEKGTAEHHPFSTEQLSAMLDLGKQGVNQLIDLQKQALGRG